MKLSVGLEYRLELLRLEEVQSGSLDIANEITELLKGEAERDAYDAGWDDARDKYERDEWQTCPECGTQFEIEEF